MAVFYVLIQLTWGIIQSLLGLFILVKEGLGREHFWFHGAYVTRWDHSGGLSLGMFVFIGNPLMENGDKYAYLTHEYGHTIQSLIYGPLYLLIVGISSSNWAKNYTLEKLNEGVSYFSVFPENQANKLGEKITGIKVPEHIPRELFTLYDAYSVKLGGVEQWISVKGTKEENPILLVMHGGPGSTLMGTSYTYQRPWERYYTVVNWDQRCSGKTASISGSESPVELTSEMIISDALELTDYLRERYHKDKIIILGHSWGTLLGANLATRYPDKYYAYISVGTMVNTRDEIKLEVEYYRNKFTSEGNRKKLNALNALGDFWKDEVVEESKTLAVNKILIEEGNSSARVKGIFSALKYEVLPRLRSTEYSFKDNLNLFGFKAYPYVIEKEMPEFDAGKLGYEYMIPVYYVEGDKDLQTPYDLAKELYEKTIAPDKEFYTLKNCAHCWDLDAPEQMAEIMCGQLYDRVKQYIEG